MSSSDALPARSEAMQGLARLSLNRSFSRESALSGGTDARYSVIISGRSVPLKNIAHCADHRRSFSQVSMKREKS